MKNLLILYFFLPIVICKAQSKEIHGDTTFWYQWTNEYVQELNLDNLIRSSEKFKFRFWTENQLIEVSDGKSCMYTFERAYDHEKILQEIPGKFYSKKQVIDGTHHSQLIDLIKNSGILKLNSCENIPGWVIGFDGITFKIECSTDQAYYFSFYWTPTYQDNLPEAELVQKFVVDLYNLLNFKKAYSLFYKDLPTGCYNTSDIEVICKE